MTLREQFENETGEPAVYNPNRVLGETMRTNHEYLEWLERKLQNTSSNSDYAKCKHEFVSRDYIGQPNGKCIHCGAIVP